MKVALCITAFVLSVALFSNEAEAGAVQDIIEQGSKIADKARKLLEDNGKKSKEQIKEGLAEVKKLWKKLQAKVDDSFDGKPPSFITSPLEFIPNVIAEVESYVSQSS